jgi:hypothetical protein
MPLNLDSYRPLLGKRVTAQEWERIKHDLIQRFESAKEEKGAEYVFAELVTDAAITGDWQLDLEPETKKVRK